MAEFLKPFAGIDAPKAASVLVERFGSPGRLLVASDEAILDALADKPAIAALIVAARDLTKFASRECVRGERVSAHSPQTQELFRSIFAEREYETLHAIFLDGSSGYIADETIGLGDFGQISLCFRPLISRLLEVGARGLILAHNHPSGDAHPSEPDRVATAQLAKLSEPLGIAVVDHLIFGGDDIFSMALGRRI